MIIPKEFLSLCKDGFINLHASILPKFRGAAPIQRSIMNKDKETGISVMKINEKLDEGGISHIFKINIEKNENSQTLSDSFFATLLNTLIPLDLKPSSLVIRINSSFFI